MSRSVTIPWGKFSDKHRRYIRSALAQRMCVAEGAIRSGKTIDHCIIAAAYLETAPDRLHLASGSSIANAKLNIGVCNGFGLENLFRGRCRWGRYRDNEALFVRTRVGERIVVFAGGGRADSYRHILGNSYGLWIATEINEHYDCADSRTSFIKVAMGRQLAARKPFTLWDMNPCRPGASIYGEYVDRYRTQGLAGGFQYEHFTIRDNATISQERLREIESRYDPNTVWYRRDILGERCTAEGLIYRQFADDPQRFIVDGADETPDPWDRANAVFDAVGGPGTRGRMAPGDSDAIRNAAIGVDFGGGRSAHAFCCVGFTVKGRLVVLDEYREKRALDPGRLAADFVDFARRCKARWIVTDVWCDSAEQTLINGLRSAAAGAGLGLNIGNAMKRAINDRIRATCMLMGAGRFFVARNCMETIDALKSAVWDSKKPTEDVRLDDGTTNIDSLDAMEYAFEREAPALIDGWGM